MLEAVGVVLITLIVMEGVAWLMHRYVMHGFLWFLHKSHHTRHNHIFELNDLFFAFYGILAMLCFVYGSPNLDFRFWIGVGISVYGFIYFLVHDVFIHRRIRIFGKAGNLYLRALYIGHHYHHKTREKEGAECFGMLWVAPKYFNLARKNKNSKTNQ